MTRTEAEALLREAKARNPIEGGAYFVYQSVADALSALPDTPMPNAEFAKSDVGFEGAEVYVYCKPGGRVHYGRLLPQMFEANA
jgi:hypothetical protein